MLLVDLFMVFGPPLAFVQQYQMIKKTKSVGSFSTLTCAILLISNIMRVFYWQAIGFAMPLLYQSMVMIIVQILLLKACIDTQRSPKDGEKFELSKFWKWTHFEHYVRFLVGLTSMLAITTTVLKMTPLAKPYGEAIGFLSMLIESGLGMPQLYRNYRDHSVKGLSFIMIVAWFIGDSLKTVYFVMENQPSQFIMCGLIQLTVDILILLQLFFYRDSGNSSSYEGVKDDGS